jgi:hypothetical protein
MAINPAGTVDVPLSSFLGLNTDLAPNDLPEGASPDCQDISFRPGSAQTRPALQKRYADAITGSVTVVYHKRYVMPNGTVLNLVLDSAGNFWKEDVAAAPGVLSLITKITPGSMAQSVSANGREYIAFSDGLHGTESPRQFDGVNLDRVSQDGPGAPPLSFTGVITPPQTLATTPPGGGIAVTSITPTDPITVTVG